MPRISLISAQSQLGYVICSRSALSINIGWRPFATQRANSFASRASMLQPLSCPVRTPCSAEITSRFRLDSRKLPHAESMIW